MSNSFLSLGVTILDIVGYPINALPESIMQAGGMNVLQEDS